MRHGRVGATSERYMSKEERRSQLLRAARDVFVSKGFHNAKIDDIVISRKTAA